MKRGLFMICLMFLASCAAPVVEESPCDVLQVYHEGECCYDFNENGICDTLEPEVQQKIKELEQEEYEKAAAEARATAQKTPQFATTVVDEFLDKARSVKSYSYLYLGDAYLVENGKITVSLVSEKDIGKQPLNGKMAFVKINTVILENKKATAYCIPDPEFVKKALPTPCQDFLNIPFEVDYTDYRTKLPIEWLEDFEHRTPAVVLEKQNIRKRAAILLKMKSPGKTTLLYVDPNLGFPIRVEQVEESKIYEYVDLFAQ